MVTCMHTHSHSHTQSIQKKTAKQKKVSRWDKEKTQNKVPNCIGIPTVYTLDINSLNEPAKGQRQSERIKNTTVQFL
jgi:hypothetical protein